MASLHLLAGVGAALIALGGARVVRDAALDQRARWPRLVEVPYAPSPAAAPFVTLGYRELGADLLWARSLSYFGDDTDTAGGLAGLIEALIALDPTLERVYEWTPRATDWVDGGATVEDRLWSLTVLDRGMAQFPDRWQLPYLAGQIYILDLETDDLAQRAIWQERGAVLLERAVRMPGAPRRLATLAAHVRTQLGQQERAVRDLRELIITTESETTRRQLIEKLAALEHDSADRIEAEARWMRERFIAGWMAQMPEVPETMYILLGDRPTPYIDFGDLAVDRDLVGGSDQELYEPLED